MLARMMRHAMLAAGMALMAPMAPVAWAAPATLRIGQQADMPSFDPTRINLGTTVLTHLLYDSLITLDADGNPHAALAKSWEFSSDGRTLTLHLRDDVTFHDGRKMTAQDVAFSLHYAATPAIGANILPFTKLIDSLATPDDDTVVMHVSGPRAAIYDLLDLLYVLDSKHPGDIQTSGNGTGAYKLSSYDPGQGAVFVRNEHYWGVKPSIPRVEIKILPDAQSAIAQLRAGAVDFLPVVSREAAEQLAGSKFQTGIAAAEALAFDVGINIASPPFDKPEVRQAVSLALDRDRIAAEVGGQASVVKCLPWPARDTEEAAGLEHSCHYDLAQAKALVDKAGATGAKVNIMTYGQSIQELDTMAQIMQAAFKQIGLDASITDMSEAAFIARFRKSQFQLTAHLYGRASRSPAALLLTAVVFWSTGNVMNMHSDSYNNDIKLVTTSPDGSPATAGAWTRIDKWLLDEAWDLPVASLPIRWASSPKLKGVRFTLDGSPIFDEATLD